MGSNILVKGFVVWSPCKLRTALALLTKCWRSMRSRSLSTPSIIGGSSNFMSMLNLRAAFCQPLVRLSSSPTYLLQPSLSHSSIFLLVCSLHSVYYFSGTKGLFYVNLLSTRLNWWGNLQKGLVSSHFFFRFRHVVHPVFERAFACFVAAVGERGGCIRGRPRERLSRTGSVGEIGDSSVTGSVLTSSSRSSVSSIFGIISSEPTRESIRVSDCVSELEATFASKMGVFIGESLLDDMEGCGDELMLRRACAPGGGCPKVRVEIIRSDGWSDQWLPVVVGSHWTPTSYAWWETKRRRGVRQERSLLSCTMDRSDETGKRVSKQCRNTCRALRLWDRLRTVDSEVVVMFEKIEDGSTRFASDALRDRRTATPRGSGGRRLSESWAQREGQ